MATAATPGREELLPLLCFGRCRDPRGSALTREPRPKVLVAIGEYDDLHVGVLQPAEFRALAAIHSGPVRLEAQTCSSDQPSVPTRWRRIAIGASTSGSSVTPY